MSDVAAILMRDVDQNLSVFLTESLDPVRRETEVHELHNADLTRRGRAVGILFGATHDALAGDFDEHGVLDTLRTVQPVVAPHFVVNLETSRLRQEGLDAYRRLFPFFDQGYALSDVHSGGWAFEDGIVLFARLPCTYLSRHGCLSCV